MLAKSLVYVFGGSGLVAGMLSAGASVLPDDFTPGERYGILTLHATTVIGIGGGMLRAALMQNRTLQKIEVRLGEVASSLKSVGDRLQAIESDIEDERKGAVDAVRTAVASARDDMLRFLEAAVATVQRARRVRPPLPPR